MLRKNTGNSYSWGLVALAWAAVIVVAACSGPAPTPLPTVAPTEIAAPATSTPAGEVDPYLPDETRTGLEPVDSIIAAATAGDQAALRNLVHYTITGCTHAEGLGGPPKCTAEQAEGTEVEVFPVLGSEGSYVSRETIDNALPDGKQALVAAFEVPADLTPEGDYWPVGKWGVILASRDSGEAMTMLVDDEGIVRIVYAEGPERLLTHREVGEFILPPPQ